MKIFSRILATVGAAAFAAILVAAAAVAFYWAHDGTIEVLVREKGSTGNEVSIRCPAFLARAAASLAPIASPSLPGEARSAVSAAREAIARIRDCPDATLVEVTSRAEHVRISKRGDRLLVETDTPEETVRIAVPLAVVDAWMRAISN